MRWFGKFACAFIGFKLFGFFGLVLGLWIGHLVDSDDPLGLFPHTHRDKRNPFDRRNEPSVAERNQVFFLSVFSMLARLARADGAISADEIASIEKFMDEDLGLDPERKGVAKNIFRAARLSEKSFGEYASDFFRVFRGQPVMLENLLDIFFRVALADGALHPAEEKMVKEAAGIFRISSAELERIWSRYKRSPDRHYTILGCTRDTPIAEIKKRYRALVLEHHPDKVISAGQPKEFVKLANEKFREIQEAYESIKEEKGFT